MRARAHAAMAMEKRDGRALGEGGEGIGDREEGGEGDGEDDDGGGGEGRRRRDWRDDDGDGDGDDGDDDDDEDARRKVSEVFWHTFEDTGASCWCVRVEDEDGESTTMSITKSVPRARKIPSDGGERPVLVSGEIRLLLAEWDDRTRIDRARRAKAKLKAAKAAAKAAAEAAEAAPTAPAVETRPRRSAETVSAAPPGFGAARRAPPPGFEKPRFESCTCRLSIRLSRRGNASSRRKSRRCKRNSPHSR